jgi:hypothetical protein
MERQEEMVKTFHLDIIITREDLVGILEELKETLPEKEFVRTIENYLVAGHLVMNLIRASTTEDEMKKFFRPVLDKMEEVKERLDLLQRGLEKTVDKGSIGEILVREHFSRTFPTDRFEVVSSYAHRGDIHAFFEVNGREEKILIEVKFYENTVPTHEVNKFWRDMEETGINYGIFVSLNERISGHPSPISFEMKDGKIAVFVNNKTIEDRWHIFAYFTLKTLIEHLSRITSLRFPVDELERVAFKISEKLKEIESIFSDLSKISGNARKFVSTTQEFVEEQVRIAGEIQLKLSKSLNEIGEIIEHEFKTLPLTGEPELPESTKFVGIGDWESLLEKKNKRIHHLIYLLKDHMEKEGWTLFVDEEGKYYIGRNDTPLLEIKGGKNRLEFLLLDSRHRGFGGNLDSEEKIQSLFELIEKIGI